MILIMIRKSIQKWKMLHTHYRDKDSLYKSVSAKDLGKTIENIDIFSRSTKFEQLYHLYTRSPTTIYGQSPQLNHWLYSYLKCEI